MAEYIERDRAISTVRKITDLYKNIYPSKVRRGAVQYCLEWIETIPTADVAPVRYSEIVDKRKAEVDGEWECARCGWQYTVCVCGKDVTQKIHYCPNCGAKMNRKDK